jgi:hypothetical protein
VSGKVTGVRFYKSSANTGSHIGNLWTTSGTRLASVTFSNETASGWQQAQFSSPVSINANTTYVVSYFAPNGHTAQDDSYFYPNPSPRPDLFSSVDSPPLHALRHSNGTVNGLARSGSSSAFPTASPSAANYWVDVMFDVNTGPSTAPGTPTGVTATPGNASAAVSWSAPPDGGSAITSYTVTPYIGSTAQQPRTVTGNPPDNSTLVTGLTNGTSYTFRVSATNAVGTGPDSAESNAVVPTLVSCSACTLWPASTVPVTLDQQDTRSMELGVKFRADLTGQIKGIRFYKSVSNTGTHVGNLWTLTGTRLATVTFTNESATGWQQAMFSTPVNITAGTLYVASYFAPRGHYSADSGYFAGNGVDSGPLHAPADGENGGQGLYGITSSSAFPTSTYDSENYWVDVVYATSAATAPAAPTNVSATAGAGTATVSWTAPSDGGSPLTGYTVTPYIGTSAQTPKTVSGSPPATSTTVTGLASGTAYTFRVSATNAVGSGPDSAPSASVTPTGDTAPGAPTGVSATPGDGSVAVSWTAPPDGGSPITGYTVTPYVGATAQATTTVTGSPPGTATTITGLSNGTAYTFTVTATNAVGTGPASAASASVTPSAPATVPAAPSGVSATAGDASAVVSWSAPSDGGSPITGYTVTPYAGSTAQASMSVTGSPPATSATVTGLSNGTAYTFRVTATNSVGTSAASAPSSSVTPVAGGCAACTIWPSSVVPANPNDADTSALELGVRFTSEVDGTITGIRFYKGIGNTGTHVGNLWTSTGTRLATVTFTNESATGWQQALFATPVAITADTTYVASYLAPNGHYAGDGGYFTTAMDRPPLHALRDGADGPNGVYQYGTTSSFPTNTWNATNYWVDVVFASSSTTPVTAPQAPTGVSATPGDASAVVTWTAPPDGGSRITSYTVTPYIGTSAQTPSTVTGNPAPTTASFTGLTNGTAYTFRVSATNTAGTSPASTPSPPVTPTSGVCAACTIWAATTSPSNPSHNDSSAVELGVKFTADVSGRVTGVRFYKGSGNTGTHVGNLWTSTGTRLATVTFRNESTTGWQQASFSSPVAITAGTTYVVSYLAPRGHYAADSGYFTAAGVDRPPLHALRDGVSGGNGVYRYGTTSGFPASSWNATNYWVDVVFASG